MGRRKPRRPSADHPDGTGLPLLEDGECLARREAFVLVSNLRSKGVPARRMAEEVMQPRGERREQIDRALLVGLDPTTEFRLEFVWVEVRFRHRGEAHPIQGACFLERVRTAVDDVVQEIRLELMERLRGRGSRDVCGAHGAAESGCDHRCPAAYRTDCSWSHSEPRPPE